MPVEPIVNYIDDFNLAWPNDNPDQLAQQAIQTRNVKRGTKGSFPNLGQAAVVRTADEINNLISPDSTQILTNKTIIRTVASDIIAVLEDVQGDNILTASFNHIGSKIGSTGVPSVTLPSAVVGKSIDVTTTIAGIIVIVYSGIGDTYTDGSDAFVINEQRASFFCYKSGIWDARLFV